MIVKSLVLHLLHNFKVFIAKWYYIQEVGEENFICEKIKLSRPRYVPNLCDLHTENIIRDEPRFVLQNRNLYLGKNFPDINCASDSSFFCISHPQDSKKKKRNNIRIIFLHNSSGLSHNRELEFIA